MSTTSKSRADYLRAYRAARREQKPEQPEPEHVCELCGKTFTARRADARFCSPACRASRWRPVTHHAVHHHPDGIKLKRGEAGYPGAAVCWHELDGGGVFCQKPAHWYVGWMSNGERSQVRHNTYCDKHVAFHHPGDVVVGEKLHEVAARHCARITVVTAYRAADNPGRAPPRRGLAPDRGRRLLDEHEAYAAPSAADRVGGRRRLVQAGCPRLRGRRRSRRCVRLPCWPASRPRRRRSSG